MGGLHDAELKALGDKAKALKARKVEQFGQLVAMTGADALDVETLAGALLDAVALKDAGAKEAWRAKGAAFFQRRRRKNSGSAILGGSGVSAEPGCNAAGGSSAASNG